MRDSYRGALLGLAAGDAVGTTLEFKAPGSFEPITDMVGGGPFGLEPGEWTDDTSMALCLADSLVELGGFDPVDQLSRYVKWYREGHRSSTGTCFDIGNTVGAALRRFEKSGKREAWCGSTDAGSAGNGSIMRLAPVVLFFSRDPVGAVEYAGMSSRTTHGAVEAVDACRLMAVILLRAIEGLGKEAVCLGPFDALDVASLSPKIAEVASGGWVHKPKSAIRGSGYVVKSLEAALWCFWHTRDFRAAVLKAANLGDDADTTAAICGQIAGAYYGVEAIPEMWRKRLAFREEIEQLAEGLRAGPAPLKRSYWAIPGQLMAGAFPGDLDPSVTRSKVRKLLAAGVRVFVNLMEADETNTQGQSFAPYDQLVADEAAAAGLSARCVRHPIRDLNAPSPSCMAEIEATLDAAANAGECAYVHCWGGRGRTGTVVATQLCRHGLATREDFEEVIERRRRFDEGGGSSPESGSQCEFVKSWVDARDSRIG